MKEGAENILKGICFFLSCMFFNRQFGLNSDLNGIDWSYIYCHGEIIASHRLLVASVTANTLMHSHCCVSLQVNYKNVGIWNKIYYSKTLT